MANRKASKPRSEADWRKALVRLLGMDVKERDALWLWDVGECIAALCPPRDRKYGSAQIDKLVENLNRDRSGTRAYSNLLYSARAVHELYRRGRIAQLCRSVQKQGHRLTKKHIEILAALPPKVRPSFEEQCVDRRLSTRELWLESRAAAARETPGKGPIKLPKNRRQAIYRMQELCRHWLEWSHRLVLDEGGILGDGPQRLSKADRKAVQELIAQVNAIRAMAPLVVQRLTKPRPKASQGKRGKNRKQRHPPASQG